MGRTEKDPNEQKPRILYVDNDRERQRGTEGLVLVAAKDMPFEVVSVFRQDEAQHHVEQSTTPPKLLMINVDDFPEEAWHWIGEVKQDPLYEKTVIMVLSSDVDPKVLTRAEELGVEAIQQLPFHLEAFSQRLTHLLEP